MLKIIHRDRYSLGVIEDEDPSGMEPDTKEKWGAPLYFGISKAIFVGETISLQGPACASPRPQALIMKCLCAPLFLFSKWELESGSTRDGVCTEPWLCCP